MHFLCTPGFSVSPREILCLIAELAAHDGMRHSTFTREPIGNSKSTSYIRNPSAVACSKIRSITSR